MTIGLIPARGGSKGVPKKNIRSLGGYPLIAYSIAASILSKSIPRTIVSTDSEEIAEIAKRYGAEVPFIRPAELASDKSPDIDFVIHAMDFLKGADGYDPEFIVHLRPTTPLRDPDVIDAAVGLIKANAESTALRSVHEMAESPYKLFGISAGYLVGLYPDDPREEYYNLPRQAFPPTYNPNGYVDIIKSWTVRETGKLHGPRMLAFISPNAGEVDKEEDFDFIEFRLKKYGNVVFQHLERNFKHLKISVRRG